MPCLARLLERSCHGELASVSDRYAGGVWPTFFTGVDVPWHGIYHSKLWRQEHMRCEVADAAWLSEPPFWERTELRRLRKCIVDVPMTVSAPQSDHGTVLAGWGTHDLIVKGAAPRDLWRELVQRHGRPLMRPEIYGPQTVRSLLQLRENLLGATRQMADVSLDLLRREPWDLFCVVLGATHRAGHYLWDLSQVDVAGLPPSLRAILESALADVYRACDEVIDALLRGLGPDPRVLVFAVHGMTRNSGWSDLFPELLMRIQNRGEAGAPSPGLLYRLKRRIPMNWSEQVISRLPGSVRNWLLTVWSARMFDWSTTQCLPLPMDHAGYLRLNVIGREPEGIVEPGAEYDSLCAELEEALRSWRDLEADEPVVAEVIRAYREAPAQARYRDRLPDLIVTWRARSAIDSKGVASPEFGEVRLPDRGRLPSGRAGNHTSRGWFVGAGPGIRPGQVEGHHILDLLPTLLTWLGVEPPGHLQGRPIESLLI
jgi:predicted AlkP superfamily phosphohydrolase/phosphomutase